jgi:hypothetical protein
MDIQDQLTPNASGHVLIRDAKTGEVIVNQRNAIHYGNLARITAQALSGQFSGSAFVNWMGFGNGATAIDTSGRVIYKTPRVSETFESAAGLYSRTFEKSFEAQNASLDVITGPSYTDIKITVMLGFNEPTTQDIFDSATSLEGDFVFDEIGLFSKANTIDEAVMLTHVIFHPVQKSQNREIEIVYTVRIQLS